MVSDSPPRRPGADNEPVTIDLDAGDVSVVAEPVRSNDSDTQGEASADSHGEGKAAEDIAEAESAASEAGTEKQADSAAAPEPRQAPAAPARPRPAVSTMIASGLFGGIAALALAGSIHYAGYLPLGSDASDTNNDLSSEIVELRDEIAALRQNPPAAAAVVDEALAGRVTAVETALAGVTAGNNDAAIEALRGEIAGLNAETERLRGESGALRAALDAIAGRDSELAGRLAQAEAKLNAPGPEQDVARAVAAAALKAAIDRGGGFEAELQVFANVAGDDPAVARLQEFATAGVPSRAVLSAEFPEAASAMLAALEAPEPRDNLAARLFSSAVSVVKVRRIGEVEGDSPQAVIARIEEALKTGDLVAAGREWDALPEAAKTAAAGFRQRLEARIEAENIVSGTLARAVDSTGG